MGEDATWATNVLIGILFVLVGSIHLKWDFFGTRSRARERLVASRHAWWWTIQLLYPQILILLGGFIVLLGIAQALFSL